MKKFLVAYRPGTESKKMNESYETNYEDYIVDEKDQPQDFNWLLNKAKEALASGLLPDPKTSTLPRYEVDYQWEDFVGEHIDTYSFLEDVGGEEYGYDADEAEEWIDADDDEAANISTDAATELADKLRKALGLPTSLDESKKSRKKRFSERARIRWTVRACHGQKYTSSSEFTTKREAEAKYEELVNEPGTDMIELCMVSTDPELIPSGTERMTFKRNGGIDYYMAVKSQRQKALNPEEFDTKLIDVSESVDTMNESWLKAQKMDLELPTWKFDRKNIRTESGRNFQEAKVSNELNFKDLTRVTESTSNYKESDGNFPIVIFEADESMVLDDDAPDSWEIQSQYEDAIEDFERLEKEMAIGDLGAWDVRLEDGYYTGLQVLVKDKDEYGDYSEEERAKETEKVNELLDRLVKEYGWQKIRRVASFSNGEAVYEPVKESKLKEADSDYIKIGNKVYPNTTTDPGNMSVDTILSKTKRAYDQEQAEKEEAARRAELEKKGAETLEKIKADLKGVETLDDRFSVLFNHLVPKSGKADTVAGELVRAMMKILYRDYNDGDVFYDGYGKETCGPSAAYICDTLPDFEDDFVHIAENTLEDDEYTQALNQITEKLFNYLLDNSYLMAEPNDQDMYDFDGDYFDEYVQTLEYDPDFSGDLEEYIRYDKISWEDVMDELSMFLDNLGIDSRKINQWARDAFTIEDLSPSELKQIEDEFPDFLSSYLEDLENQYGSVYELGEEEEEEEEEEENEDEDFNESEKSGKSRLREAEEPETKPINESKLKESKVSDFKQPWDIFNYYCNNWLDCDADRDDLEAAFDAGLKGLPCPKVHEEMEDYDYIESMYEIGKSLFEDYKMDFQAYVTDNIIPLEEKTSKKSKLTEAISGLKVTDYRIDERWIYDTFKDAIIINAKINDKDAKFIFRAARGGDIFFTGISCDYVRVPREADTWASRGIREIRIANDIKGSGFWASPLQIYPDVLKSAPKKNQKDFSFTGRYYSTVPIKDAFKQNLMYLYQKGYLTEDFCNYFNILPYGTDPTSKSSDSVEKMKKWQSGERGFNLKAASDAKLKANLKICREIGFDEGADKIQAELESRKAQLTESKVYVLYSRDGFQGKKPVYGLKETTRHQARKLLNEEVQKSGRNAFRQWRITEKVCKPEYAYKYSESIGKLLNESEGSERAHGTWNQVLDGLEDWGYYVPESYRKEKPEQWITCRKGNQEYEAEVTRYSDGEYELMKHNVNCIGCLDEKKLNKKQKGFKLKEARIEANPNEWTSLSFVTGYLSALPLRKTGKPYWNRLEDPDYQELVKKYAELIWDKLVTFRKDHAEELRKESRALAHFYYRNYIPGKEPATPVHDQEKTIGKEEIEDFIKAQNEYIDSLPPEKLFIEDAAKGHKFFFSKPSKEYGNLTHTFYMDTEDPDVLKRIGSIRIEKEAGRCYYKYYAKPDPRKVYEDVPKDSIKDLKELQDVNDVQYLGAIDSSD